MIYGYCRCSTNESKQDIERQINALKQAGADTIHFEYEHGDAEHKKELEKLLAVATPGDTILTMEVSRLARSTKQLCGLIDTVKERRLKLVILGSITVDCTSGELDPMTKAFLQMSGVFAELELSMTRARVKSGMANARAKGAAIGRPRTTAEQVPPSGSSRGRLYFLPNVARDTATRRWKRLLFDIEYVILVAGKNYLSALPVTVGGWPS